MSDLPRPGLPRLLSTTRSVLLALPLAACASSGEPPRDAVRNALPGEMRAQMRGATISRYEDWAVTRPPAALGLDPFYTRHADADGIPVVSSAKVPEVALLLARDIVLSMTAQRPDLHRELVRAGARVGIMAIDEGTMDLPEQRDWKKPAADDERLTPCERANYAKIAAMTDAEYWNARARGMGGLYTTGAAENLLGVPGTRYFGENILVHEFSHNILSAARHADPAFYARVEQAYRDALGRGQWKDSYAAVTVQEYWAEGTQFWFNSNKVYRTQQRTILSDTDFAAYDPALHALLGEVYGDRHRIAADVYFGHPARLDVPPRKDGSAC